MLQTSFILKQWLLGLHASTEGTGLTPGHGANILQALRPGEKKKQKHIFHQIGKYVLKMFCKIFAQEGRDIYIYTYSWFTLYGRIQHYIVKQLSSN